MFETTGVAKPGTESCASVSGAVPPCDEQAVAGSNWLRLAKDLGPGHTIVTVLCDSGNRYQGKLFNPAFLKEKGLPAPDWL